MRIGIEHHLLIRADNQSVSISLLIPFACFCLLGTGKQSLPFSQLELLDFFHRHQSTHINHISSSILWDHFSVQHRSVCCRRSNRYRVLLPFIEGEWEGFIGRLVEFSITTPIKVSVEWWWMGWQMVVNGVMNRVDNSCPLMFTGDMTHDIIYLFIIHRLFMLWNGFI